MSMGEGFLTDVGTLQLFFRFCRRYHVECHADRVAVMRELVKRKKVGYIRDPKAFLEGKNGIRLQ